MTIQKEIVNGVEVVRESEPPTIDQMFDELIAWGNAKQAAGASPIACRGALIAYSDIMAESFRQYAERCLERGREAGKKEARA